MFTGTDLKYYMQELPGGIDHTPPPTRLDHYGWRELGPEDNKDAVIFSRSIDQSVKPTGRRDWLPRGRVFSMTPFGTMIPGISSKDTLSVVAMLIGSHSNSGDVTGVFYGDPATVKSGASAYKDWYNANFQSLAAGYVYQTTEFDLENILAFTPGTLITTTVDDVNNFETAGIVRIARPHIDQVIGIVTTGPKPIDANQDVMSICFQGLAIPRLDRATLDLIMS